MNKENDNSRLAELRAKREKIRADIKNSTNKVEKSRLQRALLEVLTEIRKIK